MDVSEQNWVPLSANAIELSKIPGTETAANVPRSKRFLLLVQDSSRTPSLQRKKNNETNQSRKFPSV